LHQSLGKNYVKPKCGKTQTIRALTWSLWGKQWMSKPFLGVFGPITVVSRLFERMSELFSGVSGLIPRLSDLFDRVSELFTRLSRRTLRVSGPDPMLLLMSLTSSICLHLLCPVCNVLLVSFKFYQIIHLRHTGSPCVSVQSSGKCSELEPFLPLCLVVLYAAVALTASPKPASKLDSSQVALRPQFLTGLSTKYLFGLP